MPVAKKVPRDQMRLYYHHRPRGSEPNFTLGLKYIHIF